MRTALFLALTSALSALPAHAEPAADVLADYAALARAIAPAVPVEVHKDGLGNPYLGPIAKGQDWRLHLVPCSTRTRCLSLQFSLTLDGAAASLAAVNRLNADLLYARVTIDGDRAGEPTMVMEAYQGAALVDAQIVAYANYWKINLETFRSAFEGGKK